MRRKLMAGSHQCVSFIPRIPIPVAAAALVWLTRSEIGKGVSSSLVSKRKLPCQQITAHPLSARPLPPFNSPSPPFC
ncbi:hypothetical protein CDAR_424871 [Caerostris darwini]|uniref:Secreted protein n=1 Tax=Caerostris darwini TaxID=1538125 RepID=A0AAV4U1L9_9ARAC|nr:hypothetical protein CDAR_424871 [Caerostris darwini]